MTQDYDVPDDLETADILEDDNDDDDDWDVVVPAENSVEGDLSTEQPPIPETSFEITLHTSAQASSSKKSGQSSKDAQEAYRKRMLRVESHKLHTILLISSFAIRNRWLNDPLLQARLVSLTPLNIQNSFTMITKQRIPDPARRGRLFESTMMRLTDWWRDYFIIDPDMHIRSMTFEEAELNAADEQRGDVLKSAKSLMKHAMNKHGSRDTSAILFTALCRGLNIPARLVVSLQPVPWKAADNTSSKLQIKKPDIKGKGKAPQTPLESSDDDLEPVEVKVTSLKLSSKKRRVRKTPILKKAPPLEGWPPTIWTEVFSRPDSRWLPVDPIRYIVNKRKLMEPPSHDKENKMTYVLAYEEDGYVKDVTARYARNYWSKTLKKRAGVKSGRQEWWSSVLSPLARPYRLQRDEIEDQELRMVQHVEGMPTSIAAFKDHPVYVLERHLKQSEVIYPKQEIGTFRGESVYSRLNVLPLKSSETWTRLGRRVKEGCQPLKLVKQRAITINRKRAVELARAEGEESMQGLYAEEQTELYVPEPVINGVVPKNDFGNIDLYTATMLPSGATHIPYKGVAKIARALQIDFAEAVTGFEYRKGRALPVITGIVVASENEDLVTEAYWESARNDEAKRHQQRRERVLKRWTKLVQGLRIRERMKNQYGTDEPAHTAASKQDELVADETFAGGFLGEADSVLQPYSLPKPTITITDTLVGKGKKPRGIDETAQIPTGANNQEPNEVFDEDIYRKPSDADTVPGSTHNPITMQTLADIVANESSSGRDSENAAIASNRSRGRMTLLSPKKDVTTRAKRPRPSAPPVATTARVLRPRAAVTEAEKRKKLEQERALDDAMEE